MHYCFFITLLIFTLDRISKIYVIYIAETYGKVDIYLNQFINVIGKVEGTISKFKKGNKGFGYDPIFIPLNKKLTFGQMNPKKKYKMDHRMKAFNKIKKFF